MDAKSEIRDFLTSRRARIKPEEVGLTTYGPRRVPGLRREEVATLAGVSVDYYNRMERGNLGGASRACLMRSPVHYGSMKLSAPTSTTSLVHHNRAPDHVVARLGGTCVRACSGCSTP
jgi:hypothetical protein